MNVCVLGDPEDLAAAYVGWLARQRGCTLLELREGTLGVDWDYDCDDDGAGTLRVGDVHVPWEDVDGVFVRLDPEPPLPAGLALDEPRRTRFVQERREGLHQLLERLSCAVVNRPSAGRSNASKPYQMAELTAAGFTVPRWVASNSPDAVRDFTRGAGGKAIYKAASGLRSRVRMVDQAFLARLAAGTSPTVVQEYVPGTDVRVHTVDRAAFACEVTGGGVDYRFEHQGASYATTSVPDRLVDLCCDFAAAAGLVLAGFDFRVTPDRQWLCLEMNPVPSFLSYEFSSGLPIGAAVVDALTSAGCTAARVEALPQGLSAQAV